MVTNISEQEKTKKNDVILNNRSNIEKPKKFNGKQFLSKLSGAFMLPISVMAIAGIFLGVGATIVTQSGTNEALKQFGTFLQALGEPVFAFMPLLFAMAFAVAFTNEAGIAVFGSAIGMIIFGSIQSAFITTITDSGNLIGYKIFWWGNQTEGWNSAMNLKNVMTSLLGITQLNTSVFGGLIVGGMSAYLYNRFHTIQLPQFISFFGGKRFVAFTIILAMIPLAFIFLIIWPLIGIGLNYFGQISGKAPFATDSLIFGFIERSLIPFGLHHAFYAPLWYTAAGGNGIVALNDWIAANPEAQGTGNVQALLDHLNSKPGNSIGDQFLWIWVSQFTDNNVTWVVDGQTNSMPVFEFFSKELGISLGRFMQGKYGFMLLALPAAGAAMVYAAPKENRKVALGTILPASLTVFLTGITEPIEFTFLFLSPALFWGFHAVMCAISFWALNFLGAHIGMTFSGGILDLIIYGVIPFGKGTQFYWAFLVGAIYIPIYFGVFYTVIKWRDLPTPGRGGTVKLFTKEDFLNRKDSKSTFKDEKAEKIVEGFGGWNNIENFNNCASRLRYDVKDPSKVDIDKLKQAGAFGVQKIGAKHFQAIFGPQSEQLNAQILSLKEKKNKSNTKPVNKTVNTTTKTNVVKK